MGGNLYLHFPLFICVCLYGYQYATASIKVQNLGGNAWTAVGTSPPSGVIIGVHKTSVPGCIHTDWNDNRPPTKENNLYYRFNDEQLRNIAEYNWEYSRNFETNIDLLNRKSQWLICEGLDTAAHVVLNGKVLGNTTNMFLRYKFNVTGLLQEKFNRIITSFESAVRVVNATRKTLPYSIPPECPPDVQHGFCHPNLIRKEQCSFSWDWGPGFATQGIWKPIYLVAFDEAVLSDVALYYDWDAELLHVDAKFNVATKDVEYKGMLWIFIDELSIKTSYQTTVKSSHPIFSVTKKISKNSVKYWWPAGQGDQKLYNVTVKFESTGSKDISNKTVWFGFRKVELVQESINNSDGLSFYFKINDRPIFAKGSNWIPSDSFHNRVTLDNYTNLLQSAKDANMNMLRVWGGGIYETDDFYHIADKMGIMIWQDFMFACAMYPADAGFLASVSEEVNETIWRLKSHPSIVIWAGNNENEAALGTNWYNTTEHFSRYKKDYIALYVDTIQKLVSSMDSSRPFLTSSPTNGEESKTEGWVAKNPYNVHYGDVHYYNYNDDCLDWTKYPKTRFASEYGFQSWPSIETLEPVTLEEDLSWTSKFANQRNHHMDGNKQMLNMMAMHFNLPASKNEIQKFEDEIYLSQIMQGLCYKSQTEFYRRSRSEIVNGEGHTMGALYWQLNDIWQAPTWSSIEYGGKWKVVHYFAKKFFSNVALSAYDDDTTLTIYSLSDENAPIEPVTLMIEMHQWSSFGVINTWTQPLYITPQSSKLQYQNSTGTMLHYGGCDYKELCYFVIYLKEIHDVAPTFFYPVPLKTIEGLQSSKIEIKSVQLMNETLSEFQIVLGSTTPAFFVWLEATGIKGRFSDNAFHMYKPNITVSFYAWETTTTSQLKSSIKIKSLSDVNTSQDYQKEDHRDKKPQILFVADDVYEADNISDDDDEISATEIDNLYWMDGMEAQLMFGICGVLFIMFFAIMLVCVVMRFNSPRLDKPKLPTLQYSSHKGSIVRSLDEQEELLNTDAEDESGAFMLKLKNGYGHNAKNVEIRFYVT
ncbi:beta-mannosidase-like [Styela clava]